MRSAVILTVALLLMGCAHVQKPLVVQNTSYVPVTVDKALLDLNACPVWPDVRDYISDPANPQDSETSNYWSKGYEAWQCERRTRRQIADQSKRIEQDVQDRNAKH